jgi:mRNA-degrading endonuclease RelE of RelBE toxin-antitoxin system
MAGTFERIEEIPEFQKDFRRLLKRHRTLREDLDTFISTQLKLLHKIGLDNGAVVRISDLGVEEPAVYKARRFACKALKGRGSMSGIRVIYAYLKDCDTIVFIQMYYKQDRENEDRSRILAFLESLGGA